MIKLFKRRVPRKVLMERIEHQQMMIRGLCHENVQVKITLEKIAALFMPAERDLLQCPKEDAIYAPGWGPRIHFTRESLVSGHGFSSAEAGAFIDLVHEMAERRDEAESLPAHKRNCGNCGRVDSPMCDLCTYRYDDVPSMWMPEEEEA